MQIVGTKKKTYIEEKGVGGVVISVGEGSSSTARTPQSQWI